MSISIIIQCTFGGGPISRFVLTHLSLLGKVTTDIIFYSSALVMTY